LQEAQAQLELQQQQLMDLEQHLQRCKDSYSWTPPATAFAALERKIQIIEATTAAQLGASAAVLQQQQQQQQQQQVMHQVHAQGASGSVGAAAGVNAPTGGVLSLLTDAGLLPRKMQQQQQGHIAADSSSIAQQYQVLLAAKTAQIEGFKAQVDALLTAAKQLMVQQQQS
jgi:hypothetical protein